MPRRELVSRTPKMAAEVALFGHLLTVTSLIEDKLLLSLMKHHGRLRQHPHDIRGVFADDEEYKHT